MLLSYETIFSRVRGDIDDPIELSLNDDDLLEIYTERLHASVGDPRVRRLFSSIKMDDISQQMDFTLEYSVDEFTDEDFVIDILVLGMKIRWLQPKVDSVIHTAPFFGGKEEKKLLDNHSNMITRLKDLKKEQQKMIRDYGYMYNSYIQGNS